MVTLLEFNADKDPYLRHAAVMGLVGLQDFRWLESIASHPSASVRMGALLAMRRLERPEVAQFLSDAEPHLVTEAARAINDVPIDAAMSDLAQVNPSALFSELAMRVWSMRISAWAGRNMLFAWATSQRTSPC